MKSEYVVYRINSDVSLTCEVEAYPEAVKYWEKEDGRLVEPSEKYSMNTVELDRYRVSVE